MQSHWLSTNMEIAETASAPLLIGMDEGNGVFDGFGGLSYVDVAGAANLDTSKAGVLKATLVSGGNEASPTPSLTPTSDLGDITIWDRGWSLDNGKKVVTAGLFSADAFSVTFVIVRRDSSTSYTAIQSQTFSHPGGGWADLTLSSPYTVPGSGTFYLGVYTASPNKYPFNTDAARGFNGSGVLTGTDTGCTENTGNVPALRVEYEGVANDLTVASVAIGLAEAPDWGRLVAIVDTKGAAINTDLVFALSRDGAAYQTFAMGAKYTRADGSIYVDSGIVNFSSATGTTGKWRLQTFNGAAAEIMAIGATFGVDG